MAIKLEESCESHEICDHVESPGSIVLKITKHAINSTKPVLVSQSFCLAYFHHARIMTSVTLSTMTECSAMSPAGTSEPLPCSQAPVQLSNGKLDRHLGMSLLSSIVLTTLFSTVVMVL